MFPTKEQIEDSWVTFECCRDGALWFNLMYYDGGLRDFRFPIRLCDISDKDHFKRIESGKDMLPWIEDWIEHLTKDMIIE